MMLSCNEFASEILTKLNRFRPIGDSEIPFMDENLYIVCIDANDRFVSNIEMVSDINWYMCLYNLYKCFYLIWFSEFMYFQWVCRGYLEVVSYRWQALGLPPL